MEEEERDSLTAAAAQANTTNVETTGTMSGIPSTTTTLSRPPSSSPPLPPSVDSPPPSAFSKSDSSKKKKTVRIMESMKRVASKSAKRSVSNPDAADDEEQEVLEKPKAKPKIKSHSIHGMMEGDRGARPHRSMGVLTVEEKKFLLAVERGDVASVRRMLADKSNSGLLDINCCDPLGRSGLLMGIDNENLEMIDLLLDHKVETKDALLHAINEEYVEAVEVLLDNEDCTHKEGEPHSWEAIPPDAAAFTPDITPLVLAAHRDNYEIIKILLDRGAVLPMPHDVRCGCEECLVSRCEDSLRHSRSRINAYRALASPSLIALSSKDPILTAFELSWELRRLSFVEHEFKSEYQELRNQCQKFATALLDHTRSSYELEVLLNHDPTGPAYSHGEKMTLNRLKLAIKYRQKKFVAHPNVQQLLASIWYDGLPGFLQMNMVLQFLEIFRIGLLFPLFSLSYMVCPWTQFSQRLRKPFIKFIAHSSSYIFFLVLLMMVAFRAEVVIAEWLEKASLKLEWLSNDTALKRGSTPTVVEWLILGWVVGLIWSEIKQLWDVGLKEYVHDAWNLVDFFTNSLYVATIALRVVSYYRVQEEIALGLKSADYERHEWDTWDPMLISEGLFAAANIFSNLKLVYIFSINPHLGPLQVTLGRMVFDMMKWALLFILVHFAFSCGANQLLWYYADLEKKRCIEQQNDDDGEDFFGTNNTRHNMIDHDINHCLAYRRFANLWETTQTLFWAVFGLIDLENFELTGIKEFTRFFGLLMFGCYSFINIIVLLNLLIAMMNHSYQIVSSGSQADVEWKFARSKLWISYFEEGGTVPPPFNIIPTPKSMYYLIRWIFHQCCGRKKSRVKKEHLKTKKVRQASERDFKYQGIMKNLVRRYVTQEQQKAENEGVTEDDVNEIKNDISAFRFELIEIMRQSGMKVSSSSGLLGAAGKKNRQKERRLMKGFNVSAGGLGGRGAVGGSTGGAASTAGGGQPNNGGGGGGPEVGFLANLTARNRTEAEVNATSASSANAGGGGDQSAMGNPFRGKSPMTKLVRLAKLAASSKDGIIAVGIGPTSGAPANSSASSLEDGGGRAPSFGVRRDSHEDSRSASSRQGSIRSRTTGGARAFLHRLSGHNDDAAVTSAAPSPSAGPALPAMPEENEAAAATVVSPSSSAFADRAERPSKRDKYNKARSPIQCLNPLQLQKPEEGCGLADAELGNVGARIGGKEEENQRALHRTFRVDLNDTVIEDMSKTATSSEQDSAPLLAMADADDDDASDGKVVGGGGCGGGGSGSAAPASASPSVAKVQGVRQGRASNSGWL